MMIYTATMFLDGFSMENHQFSNVPTSEKHSKYCGFHLDFAISTISRILWFQALFGSPFGRLWGSPGLIWEIFEGIGSSLEFQ